MNYLSTHFRCDIAENRRELGKSVVTHLPSPKTLHCLNVECFKSDERMIPHQLPGGFPLPGQTLIGDASVKTRQITLRPSIVGRAFLLTGKNAVKSFHGLQVLLKEFRTLNGCFVRAGKVGFQTEVWDEGTKNGPDRSALLGHNFVYQETKPHGFYSSYFHQRISS